MEARRLNWSDLSAELQDALAGRLAGLWEAPTDEAAFNALATDKQQALLLLIARLRARNLWHAVRKIENVYGEGGVGVEFTAWPLLDSTLESDTAFTKRWGSHGKAKGFYEKAQPEAALHLLYLKSAPPRWHVHFDLYSPVYSLASALRHLRYEHYGKLRPDWRMIKKALARQVPK